MVVGIVAEYNPFHNGHKLQLDYAKNVLKADTIIVAMSGSFTQRGEIACFDKYIRAEAALLCGADIILEIPTIFSTSSAKEFAAAGVSLLAATGVVDTILFGAESDDVNLFTNSAQKLIELESNGTIDNDIKTSLALGETYAVARSKALESYIPSDLINSPNSILGLEYCRYIKEQGLNMNVAILKRAVNNYNSSELTGKISSASAIRAHLNKYGLIEAVPKSLMDIYNNNISVKADDISEMLHYKLLSTTDFSKYLDCNDDLSDRINKSKEKYISFTQFCDFFPVEPNPPSLTPHAAS